MEAVVVSRAGSGPRPRRASGRRSKRVPRTGKAGRQPERTKVVRTALVTLVMGGRLALSMWAFRLLA